MSDPAVQGASVVCSVLERSPEEAAERLGNAPRGCAYVEIRADHLRAEETADLVRRQGPPVIVSVRRATDGGHFNGSEEERAGILWAALEAGARFVDVERGSPAAERLAEPEFAARAILSDHGRPCRADALDEIYREMAASPAARLKIVPTAAQPIETEAVRDLLREGAERPGRLACFAMGRAGAISRLLATAWGSWATYGAAGPGMETAPGQFTAEDLLQVYDAAGIRDTTRRFALIGSRVSGSPSPAMHRAAYAHHGLDARYLPVEVDELEEFTALTSRPAVFGIEAFAVTMPFKEDAARRCAVRDPLAEASGTVNTVLDAAAAWRGHNTDGPAALALIREILDPAGAGVAVLGAGGTARALGASLAGAGARVTLFNRSEKRGREAARRLAVEAEPAGRLRDHAWDVLVNATPQGAEGERFLDPDTLRGKLVLDAVYAARPTALARDARKRGLAVVDGFELLTEQAALQFSQMTGHEAPRPEMSAAGMQWLLRRGA